MKNTILLILVVFAVISCKEAVKKEIEVVQEETITKPAIALYTFDGGAISANNLNLFAQGDTYKGESKQLSNPFYIIKHPDGILLWDSGLPEGLIGQDPYTTPDGAFTISRKDSIVNQLATIGLKKEDIDYIAFSHIHFDHTGAANHFAGAKWLVQKPEFDFAISEEIKTNGFYAPDSFKALTNVIALSGDHDVFGDGSVIIKSMPGHTLGHQVLYLDLPENGSTLLSGDLYHFQENRDGKIVPGFNHDIPMSKTSIDAFEAFAKAKNAKVYIQHEQADFDKMPVTPNTLN